MTSIINRFLCRRSSPLRNGSLRVEGLPGLQTVLFLIFIGSFVFIPAGIKAQSPDPAGAFLRSLAVPGWGHYHADHQNWNRGKMHLTADILLIAGLTGSVVQERNLRMTYHTQAKLRAGVDTSHRGRSFLLAVGGYGNLEEYNDVQLRSRNWSRIFPDEPENRWEWQHEEDRHHYNERRSRRENAKNRVPMLVGAMVVNRVLSAVSAYNRARSHNRVPDLSVVPVYDHNNGITGYMGTLRFTY